MPSPFPGMNPYLEQEDVWHDFHKRFMADAAEMLLPQVRPNYIVKLDEHAYIHELPANERHVGRRAVDVERDAFIKVLDRKARTVVAVIELLSLHSKRRGIDREAYLVTRRKFLEGSASLVEIDLLRGWLRPPLPVEVPTCDYYALVSRADDRSRAAAWPIGLRQSLPLISVPLRRPHPDARLDLGVILNRVYDAAGYEDYIYAGSLQPPLAGPDAEWTRRYLPARS